MSDHDDDDDDEPLGTQGPLPPKYPGTWNVWSTTSRKKIDRVYSGKASDRQLLTNEIGDYAHRVTPAMHRQIKTEIAGKTWMDIPLIVHRIVCPECSGSPTATWHQPMLFEDP